MAILARKPRKNTTAIEASIQARRRLALRCSGVAMPAYPMTLVAVASSLGGVSKVWNGAGEGTSHSRPSAASQGFCGAFSPWPRMAGQTTNTKKYTCIRPKPKAPIEAGSTTPVEFTLQVRNHGPSDDAGVVTVSDTLPVGFVGITASGSGWACDVEGRLVTCTLAGALGANESATPITVRIHPNAVPVLTSTPALAPFPTVTGTVGTPITDARIETGPPYPQRHQEKP